MHDTATNDETRSSAERKFWGVRLGAVALGPNLA